MAKNKAQITKDIELALMSRKKRSLNWGYVASTFGSASNEDKNLLVEQIRAQNINRFARIFFRMLNDKIKTDANVEAEAMMADDNLTLEDLQKFL